MEFISIIWFIFLHSTSKMAPKEKEKVKEEKGGKGGKKEEVKKKQRKYPKRPNVFKDHKDHSNKRKGPTEQQARLKKRRHRKEKPWDRKYRKINSQGVRYYNVLDDIPELKKVWGRSLNKNGMPDPHKLKALAQTTAFYRKYLRCKKYVIKARQHPINVDLGQKRKDARPASVRLAKKWKRVLKLRARRCLHAADLQSRTAWRFSRYAYMFGPYIKKAFLAMYFKDHPKPEWFVRRNLKKGLGLAKRIYEVRLQLIKGDLLRTIY